MNLLDFLTILSPALGVAVALNTFVRAYADHQNLSKAMLRTQLKELFHLASRPEGKTTALVSLMRHKNLSLASIAADDDLRAQLLETLQALSEGPPGKRSHPVPN